jgi:hypothetical protein
LDPGSQGAPDGLFNRVTRKKSGAFGATAARGGGKRGKRGKGEKGRGRREKEDLELDTPRLLPASPARNILASQR